jgi:hypothetical protein
MDYDKFVDGVRRIFARKGDAVVSTNLSAIAAGYNASKI